MSVISIAKFAICKHLEQNYKLVHMLTATSVAGQVNERSFLGTLKIAILKRIVLSIRVQNLGFGLSIGRGFIDYVDYWWVGQYIPYALDLV